MPPTLSSEDHSNLTSLQRVLLSPLEHDRVEDWCTEVLRHAEKLFHADRSALMLPAEGKVYYLSESIPSRYMESFENDIAEYEPGALRFSEGIADRAWSVRRQKRLPVWSIPMLSRLLGRPLKDIPMYHDVVKPAGLTHSAVATVPVRKGEAFLGVSDSRVDRASLSEEEMLSLMEIVFPSFEAGVDALLRLDEQRAWLGTAADELAEAIAIFGAGPSELHRSSQLREILSKDPEREALERRVRQLARTALRFGRNRRSVDPQASGAVKVETQTARYALRASLVGRGVLGLKRAVLVSVERLTPQLPSKRSLVDRFELTPRQAEVALLLAEGLSDQEIGERLGISHHTVRHHAEWVFRKLDIHSRKAVGLKLLHLRLE